MLMFLVEFIIESTLLAGVIVSEAEEFKSVQ